MGRWTPLILMAGGLAILLGTLLGINFPMGGQQQTAKTQPVRRAEGVLPANINVNSTASRNEGTTQNRNNAASKNDSTVESQSDNATNNDSTTENNSRVAQGNASTETPQNTGNTNDTSTNDTSTNNSSSDNQSANTTSDNKEPIRALW